MTAPVGTLGGGTRARGGRAGAGVLHRVRGLFTGLPVWLWVALVGCAVGWALVAQTPLVVILLAGLLLVLLSTRALWPLALLALAFSPLGTMITAHIPPLVDFRFTLMSWWLPAAGVFLLGLFGGRRIVLSRGTLALTVYGLLLELSALWTPRPEIALREGFQFFTFVWIFLVIDNVVRTPRQLVAATWAFLIGASLLVGGSAISVLVTPILPELRIKGGVHLTLVKEYYHPVTVAACAGAIVLISAALLLGGRFSRAGRLGLSTAVTLALLFHAAVLKRLESVGLMVAGFLVLSFYGWRRSTLWVISGVLLVVAVALAWPQKREHFENAADLQESRWHYALPITGFIMWKQSPILGHGAGSFSYMSAPILSRMRILGIRINPEETKAPHNLVAKLAAETGVVGFTLFSVFVGIVLWTAWQGGRMRNVRLPEAQAVCRGMLGASLIQLLVAMGENVDNAAIFWIVLALGYRAACMLKENGAPAAAAVERPLKRRAWAAGRRPVAAPRIPASGQV